MTTKSSPLTHKTHTSNSQTQTMSHSFFLLPMVASGRSSLSLAIPSFPLYWSFFYLIYFLYGRNIWTWVTWVSVKSGLWDISNGFVPLGSTLPKLVQKKICMLSGMGLGQDWFLGISRGSGGAWWSSGGVGM